MREGRARVVKRVFGNGMLDINRAANQGLEAGNTGNGWQNPGIKNDRQIGLPIPLRVSWER